MSPTVRVVIGTLGRSEAVVYEVDRAQLLGHLDTEESSGATANWIAKTGREVFRTPFYWAYGIGGEG
ncbi:MAG: hypothetical protein IVW52_04920 [Acidimicrobiales bacterium]|nr:hypothetical protein [Acidimicrobiales bacterium]